MPRALFVCVRVCLALFSLKELSFEVRFKGSRLVAMRGFLHKNACVSVSSSNSTRMRGLISNPTREELLQLNAHLKPGEKNSAENKKLQERLLVRLILQFLCQASQKEGLKYLKPTSYLILETQLFSCFLFCGQKRGLFSSFREQRLALATAYSIKYKLLWNVRFKQCNINYQLNEQKSDLK